MAGKRGPGERRALVLYAPLVLVLTLTRRAMLPAQYRALRAGLYGASVLLSCFLMLVFMTYNVRRLRSWACLGWFLKAISGIPYLCGRRWRCCRTLSL